MINLTDALKEMLLDMILSALNGFDSMVADAQNVLTAPVDSVWNSVLTLANVLKPFCYTIIGICLLIEMANVMMKVDLLKWEHGLKMAVKMVLAKVCIDVAPTFLRACYAQATDWIQSVSTQGADANLGSSLSPQMEGLMDNISGLGSVLGLFASLIIVVISIKICGLLVQVVAYGRMFELYVYLAVSPLPCAFFPLGDGNGGGFSRITGKFFKSFAAVCLQGVMMILCMRIFNMIIGNAFNELINDAINSGAGEAVVVSDLCYTMLLGAIVLVMSVFKCGGWAKNILDAV